jgi:RNA polymerase sigma-70 factor (ECF subfamily)
MSDSTQELLATRWSLLRRLRDRDDQQSWQEFFDTYWRLIHSVARKAGLSEAEAQDVVQETMLALTKTIDEFRCDPEAGSFKAWLLRLTRWRILDQLAKRLPQRSPVASDSRGAAVAPARRVQSGDEESRTDTLGRVADPAGVDLDQLWEREWQATLVERASEQIKAKVDSKQWQIFDLSAFKGWKAGDVARTLRVSVAQVYLAKHRVGAALKAEVKRLEKGG